MQLFFVKWVPSRSQVAAKWQESFNRLNESVPGISGLLSFSEVCCILLERKKNISLTGTIIIGVTVEYRDVLVSAWAYYIWRLFRLVGYTLDASWTNDSVGYVSSGTGDRFAL